MSTLYKQTNWGQIEKELLSDTVVDGITLAELEHLLPDRSPGAISKKALSLGFSTKSIDGIKFLKVGIRRRNRRVQDEVTQTIVGEPRVATTTQEPTSTLECTNTDISSVIVACNAESTVKTGLEAYTEAIEMLISNNLPADHAITCILSTYILEVSNKDVS